MQDIKSFCQDNNISEVAVRGFVQWFQSQAKKNPLIIQWLEFDQDACIKKAMQEYMKQSKEYFDKLMDKESQEYKKLVVDVYNELKERAAK